MKLSFWTRFFGCLILTIPVAFAITDRYAIIVDAGSSGSRLHLFQYHDENVITDIKEFPSKKVSPGLSSFAGKSQEEINKYLQPLFDYALQELNNLHVDPQTVGVEILATAGMRLIPDDAPEIYSKVKNFLENHYSFQIRRVETISGKMEGLYSWLDVNYLAKNFQNHTSTIGSLDMGGASTQIAFEVENNTRPDDETTLKIDGQQYTIFSKSFLYLGQDQARQSMNLQNNFYTCYPINYKFQDQLGYFNFENCNKIYSNLIADKQVQEQITSVHNKKFIAYSGAFFAYKFFNLLQKTDQKDVTDRIKEICENKDHNYDWWQKTFPNEPSTLLPNYCTNDVYISNLFYNNYHLGNGNLTVSDNINQQSIDWTLGAMIYQLLENR